MATFPSLASRAGGLVALVLSLALAGPLRAAAQEGGRAPAVDMTGTWILEVVSPNGVGTRDVTLVQKGDSISGEISSSMASGTLKGTIQGNVVAFIAEVSMQSGPFEIAYRAILVDGALKDGTVDFGSYGTGTFTGHRKASGGEG
jgi:hypothetical protein